MAAQADQWQGKIKVAWNTAVLVTGQALRAMKQEMPHGSFESWWREELKLKDRKTVADLMAASEVLEEAPMDSPLVSLPPRTLGILKRGGGKAVSTAAQRMADGERITEAKAKAIVQPVEEAPESKCGDSPHMDVTLPTAEELMARVLNLEAENAQLRDELQAQPAVAEQASDEEGAVRIHNPSGESFDRIESLIEDIEDIHRELFEGGLSEGQWQDLSQQYHALQYFADIRWQNRRKELEQIRETFDAALGQALTGSLPQLDGKDCCEVEDSLTFKDPNARVLFHYLDGCHQMVKTKEGRDFLKAQNDDDLFALMIKAEKIYSSLRFHFNKASGSCVGLFAQEAHDADTLAEQLFALIGDHATGGWTDLMWTNLTDTLSSMMKAPAIQRVLDRKAKSNEESTAWAESVVSQIGQLPAIDV